MMKKLALIATIVCFFFVANANLVGDDVDYFVLDMLYPPSVCAFSYCDTNMKKSLSNSFVAHALIAISSNQQARERCPSTYGRYRGETWGRTYRQFIDANWPNFSDFESRDQVWEDFGTCWLEWAQVSSRNDVKDSYTAAGFQEKYFDKGIELTNKVNPSSALSALGSPVQLNAENDISLIDAALQKKWGLSRYHLFCHKYAGSDYLTRVRVCFNTKYEHINCNVMLQQDTRKSCGDKITIPLFP